MYQAMARRYRPQHFDDVIGQGHVARTLKNAITGGRVAHAYLFCGPHGCGKTSMARIFAKALNCTGGPLAEIPADCPICADISSGQDPDVIEIDGASNNGVEQVRSLREQAAYVPARARFKIYIIDEVHMLSVAAFNALLKTLEEPPPHVKFILATTEPHKLLETVLSRCQRFDFRLVPAPEIAAYLKMLCEKEHVPAEADALDAVAAFSGGSMRDALVLVDQLISFCPEGMTREDVERVRGVAGIDVVTGIFDTIARGDCARAMALVDGVSRMGTGAGEFLDQLIEYGRDLMRVCITKSLDGVSAYGPARACLQQQAEAMGLEQAILILDVFSTARVRVRGRALSNPYVPLEMAVARLAGLEGITGLEQVVSRIESIAKSGALSGGADVRVVPVAALSHQTVMPPPAQTAIPAQAEAQVNVSSPAEEVAPAESSISEDAPVSSHASEAPGGAVKDEAPSTTLPQEAARDAAQKNEPSQAAEVPQVSEAGQAIAASSDTDAPVISVAVSAESSASAAPVDVTPKAVPSVIADDAAHPSVEQTISPDALLEKAPVEPALVEDAAAAPELKAEDALSDRAAFLRSHWDDFRDAVRAGSAKDLAYMHDVFAMAAEGERVVFRIPANGKWLLEQLEETDRHARIEAALTQVIGAATTFRMVLEDAPEESASDDGYDDGYDDGDVDADADEAMPAPYVAPVKPMAAASVKSVSTPAASHVAPARQEAFKLDDAAPADSVAGTLRERQRDAMRDEGLQQLVTRFDAQILNIEDIEHRA